MMLYFLAQLTLAVQGDDVEKWANILLVVVLAALWAVAGLLKARKIQPKDEQEQTTAGRQQKPSPLAKSLRKELFGQRSYLRPSAPAPSAQYRRRPRQELSAAIRVRAGTGERQFVQRPSVAPLAEPKLPPLISGLEAALQPVPEPVSRPIEGLGQYGPPAAEKPEPEFSLAFLLAYDDPEQLRRAILHYEILGKPLSLRRPGENIIGL